MREVVTMSEVRLRGSAAFGLPVGTRVLSPTGWRPMRELVPGDYVIDIEGRVCSVLAVASCGVGPVWEVRLRDGSALTAGAGQLLPLAVGSTREQVTLTTLEVGRLLDRHVTVHVARCRPVDLPPVPLPIHPYALGVILGDACVSGGTTVTVWSREEEIVRRVEEVLPAGARLTTHPARQQRATGWNIVGTTRGPGSNPVLTALRGLGVMGRHAQTKSIPELYLFGSAADRHELLMGMLDTDGCADQQGRVSWSSASPELARGLVHVVQSLGGRCKVSRRGNVSYTAPTQVEPKRARDSYRVRNIALPELGPFHLGRKATRVRGASRSLQWSVRAVVPAGVSPLMSIAISGETGVLLADGFVPVAAALAPAATVMCAA